MLNPLVSIPLHLMLAWCSSIDVGYPTNSEFVMYQNYSVISEFKLFI